MDTQVGQVQGRMHCPPSALAHWLCCRSAQKPSLSLVSTGLKGVAKGTGLWLLQDQAVVARGPECGC